ncbi:alpha/beta hydrolase [Brevibacillus daliensis]|uniref:alpha/beta hydrolase n=1 Tax=Brevibacillus daliensis TaxID=2892995 RepID=UPI001E358FF0|nr:alpha/beta hydrolase [Brevibacillus daliensis]
MHTSFLLPLDETFVIRGNVHTQATEGEKQPILLFCHGFKGFKDWGSFPYVAEQLSERGITVIRFNFSANGVGESTTEFDELEKFGINTFAREIADLTALVEAIKQNKLPHAEVMDYEKIFVMGHSKGGGDSILFGTDNPDIKGIITWNGISHVNLFDQKLRQEISEKGVSYIINGRTGQEMPITQVVIDDVDQNQEAYHLVEKVRHMSQPICIIQGDKDFARLVQGASILQEAAKRGELHWIVDADHVMNTKHPFAGSSEQLEEAITITAEFVRTHSER